MKCPNCNSLSGVTLKYSLPSGFKVYFCPRCLNGFTYPVPKDISRYYHLNYWLSPGILGKTKKIIFNLFQNRRKNWLQEYLTGGNILEIGAGEGEFLNSLERKFDYIGIEFPEAKIKNKDILKVDFLKWKTKIKFDAVIFWESLEHLPNTRSFLKKTHELLRKDGYIFIEAPRFNCVESYIFGKYWHHLDPPRHLVHLTDFGLEKLLSRFGFKVIKHKNIIAYEYVIWGFSESFLNFFRFKPTDYFKKTRYSFLFLVFLPLFMIAFVVETMFYLIDESPIQLVIAKKDA